MWELEHDEGWASKDWCFWTVVLVNTLESPLDSRRSNQSILKEISPEYSLEGLVLKLKLQYIGRLMWSDNTLQNILMLGKGLALGSFPVVSSSRQMAKSIATLASAAVFSMIIQDWFPLGLTGFISLLSRGLSVFSTPQFKSINSSTFCLLYGSTLTFIHDYWKNHSFDYMDLCWQII